jgi:hypothetical protein
MLRASCSRDVALARVRTALMRTALRKTAAALCGAAGLLAGVVVAAPVAQAANSYCYDGYLKDNGEGYAVTRSAAHLKQYPYADCANVTLVPKGHKLYLWCYLDNLYNHKWWYVREQGTNFAGYISDDSIVVHEGDDNGDGQVDIVSCGWRT